MLRGYVRQRSRLFELASQQVQLMHKALVQMNLQLNHVVSDITGATGMNIIRAIVSGQRSPADLAKYRHPRCQKDEKEIAKALDGNYRQEHLLALKHALAAYDFFHQQALECEEAIEQMLAKWEKQAESTPIQNPNPPEHSSKNGRGIQKKTKYNLSPYHFEAESSLEKILHVNLTNIPGLDINGIMKILAEIGLDMTKWPSAKHFASWLG